jgi:predicted DNA-binding transcriptional regulator AlpA
MDDWRSSLTDLLAAAEQAPQEDIPDLLAELERAKATAYARLLSAQNRRTGDTEAISKPEDGRLLTAEAVADRLSVDVRWVYRHADDLGAIRLSEKCLRFPRATVDAYLRSRCASNGRDIDSMSRR